MNSNSAFIPGMEVTLRGVGKRVFWAYPTVVVQDTPGLIGLYLPTGSAGKNVQTRPAPQELLDPDKLAIVDHQWSRTNVLIIIVPGDAFSVYVMWQASTRNPMGWYINLQDPIKRTRIGFDTMDHMLDVVVSADMREWNWKDGDELAAAEKAGVYTPDEVRKIRANGEKALDLMMNERRTFYEQWKEWSAPVAWRIPRLSPDWGKNDVRV